MTSSVRFAALAAVVGAAVALAGGDARAFTQTAAGYVCTDSEEAGGPAFAWDDISTSGTLVSFAPDGDEGAATATLPFSFTFGGTAYTSVNIMSNGFLTFGAAPTSYYWSNSALSATTTPSNAIYGFWDDLDQLSGGQVRTQSMGAGATQRFVISWIGVPHWSLAGTVVTFQIALFANGTIRIQYGTMTGTLTSCTVGIKTTVPNEYNANNTTTTNNVYANLAIQFAPPAALPPPPPPGGGTPAAGDDDDRSRTGELKDEMCGGSAAAAGGLGAMAVALLGALALIRRR